MDQTHDCPADRVPPVRIVSDTQRIAPADMEVIEQHLGMVMSRIEDVSKAALTQQQMADAVRAGLIEALHDERTWAAAAAGIRTSAHREAGNILVGALSGAFRKAMMFAVAGLLVYWVGGWSALAAVWHAVFGGKP